MFSENQYINYAFKVKRIRQDVLFLVSVIVSLGFLFVYDVSALHGWWNYGDPWYFVKRHAVFIFMGICSMIFCMKLNLEDIQKNAKKILLLAIVVLVAVLLVGRKAGGARRWINLLGFNFQPAEFVKIAYVIYVSDFLSRKKNYIRKFAIGILPMLLVTGLVCGLIVFQPDYGNTALIGGMMIVMFWIANMDIRYFLGLVIFAVSGFAAGIVVSPYRMARVTSFLDPWADYHGKGFQLIQSQIALGSGGFFGRGIGESIQKLFFLPAVHTDFIFAIVGEELGFVGVALILILFFYVFYLGIKISRMLPPESFKQYLCRAIVFIQIAQILFNVSVVSGLLPTKGLPLPFISYGGSSTVANFMLLGLFFNATKGAEHFKK